MTSSIWFKLIITFHLWTQHLVCTDKICQNFKFFIDQDLVVDHALQGHVFKSATVDSVSQCHVTCKDDCRCISMNYVQTTPRNNCQLNDINKIMEPEALKYKPGTHYYDLVREYLVVSICAIFLPLYNFIQELLRKNIMQDHGILESSSLLLVLFPKCLC